MRLTDGVSFYNVMKHSGYGTENSEFGLWNSTIDDEAVTKSLYKTHVGTWK